MTSVAFFGATRPGGRGAPGKEIFQRGTRVLEIGGMGRQPVCAQDAFSAMGQTNCQRKHMNAVRTPSVEAAMSRRHGRDPGDFCHDS